MYAIYHDIRIQCSVSELYKTITTPKGLNIWWTKSSDGIPELGNTYQFYFSDEYDWRGKVVALGNDHVSYLMTEADEDWQNTRLNFKIITHNEGSHTLRFEHVNWKNINDHFRQTSCCWAEYLLFMKGHLESKS